MLDSSADVRTVDAVDPEQLLGHARDRPRSVHVQLGNPARSLVPPLEHEATVVHAVVIVKMGKERVCYVDRSMSALDEAMMRTRPVVPDDEIAADFNQVA